MDRYQKKGYLFSNFRVFRLRDTALTSIPFHYHDFHKIILFLDGSADYVIEGKTYQLIPRDIIFVSAGEIHRPVFHSSSSPYERIVIYVAPDFLARCQAQDPEHNDLAACFCQAKKQRRSCIRLLIPVTIFSFTWINWNRPHMPADLRINFIRSCFLSNS